MNHEYELIPANAIRAFIANQFPSLASKFAREKVTELTDLEDISLKIFDQTVKLIPAVNLSSRKLDTWINFLRTSEYPNWFKLFVFEKVRNLGSFNKPGEDFNANSDSTKSYSPELNKVALDLVFGSVIIFCKQISKEYGSQFEKRIAMLRLLDHYILKNRIDLVASNFFSIMQNLNFSKLYAFALIEAEKNIDQFPIAYRYETYIHGDEERLENDIRGYGTGLCISWGLADTYLNKGSTVVIIYTQDRFTKQLTRPRVAIARNSKGEITEVKGINPGQQVEHEMENITNIVKNELLGIKIESPKIILQPQKVVRKPRVRDTILDRCMKYIRTDNSENIKRVLDFYKDIFIASPKLSKTTEISTYLKNNLNTHANKIWGFPVDFPLEELITLMPVILDNSRFIYSPKFFNLYEIFGPINIEQRMELIKENLSLFAKLLGIEPDSIAVDSNSIVENTKILIGYQYNKNPQLLNKSKFPIDIYGEVRFFDYGKVIELPENLTIYGDLIINSSQIQKLPNGLKVWGEVNIFGCPLKEIGYVELYGRVEIANVSSKLRIDPNAQINLVRPI